MNERTRFINTHAHTYTPHNHARPLWRIKRSTDRLQVCLPTILYLSLRTAFSQDNTHTRTHAHLYFQQTSMREWIISCWRMIQPPGSHHTITSTHNTSSLTYDDVPSLKRKMRCNGPYVRHSYGESRAGLHHTIPSCTLSSFVFTHSALALERTEQLNCDRFHAHTHTHTLSPCLCPLSVLLSVPLSSLFRWLFVTVQIHCGVRYMPFHSVRTQQYSVESESFKR